MKFKLKIFLLPILLITLINSKSTALNYNDNLFDKIINSKGSITSVNQFSNSYSLLGIQEITISEVTANSIKFYLKTDLFFINSSEKDLNSKEFIISRDENGIYYLKSGNNWQIKNALNKKSFDVVENGQMLDIKEINEDELLSPKYEELIVFTETLYEFITTNLEANSATNSIEGKRKYVGTGVGFHTNSADAHMFCAKDHAAILASHPGWWSPGISYACAFGSDHFCVCTSNFYTGTP